MVRHRLLTECLGEFLGTALLIFLGLATGAAANTTGAQSGLWQVAVVWGFSVALAIFLVDQISAAHLNPAVTISLAVSRRTRFPMHKVIPYILAQLLGAVTGGALVLALYGSALRRYERIHFITRGETNSTLSAMMFGEYFPNPQIVKNGALALEDVSPLGALLAEAMGTFVLMLMVRSLTDPTNSSRPAEKQAPFFIGFTVAALVSVIAPITQAGFNPARDFGPRLVAAVAGWGSIAIPGPRGGFWVYIVGPILGAVAAGLLYDLVVYPAYVVTGSAVQEPYKDDEPRVFTLSTETSSVVRVAATSAGTSACVPCPSACSERGYHALNDA